MLNSAPVFSDLIDLFWEKTNCRILIEYMNTAVVEKKLPPELPFYANHEKAVNLISHLIKKFPTQFTSLQLNSEDIDHLLWIVLLLPLGYEETHLTGVILPGFGEIKLLPLI